MEYPTGPASENAPDSFKGWDVRYAKLSRLASEASDAAEAQGLDNDAVEEAGEAVYRQRDQIEDQIISAPCTSHSVAAVKLRLALTFLDDDARIGGEDIALVAQVAAYLDGSPTGGLSPA